MVSILVLFIGLFSTPTRVHTYLKSNFIPDFDTCMSTFNKVNTPWNIDDPERQQIKYLYDNYFFNNTTFSSTPLIPKIIHHVWLGSPFPEKYKVLRDTWLAFHPDWEYKLWTDEDIRQFGLINKRLYDAASNYGEKSDIVRYEILCRIGGLYVDTDFECLQPFDIFHHCCNFYTGLGFEAFRCYNGLMGSAPNHPILRLCITNLQVQAKLNDRNNDPNAIVQRTGPDHFTQCIKQYLSTDSIDKMLLLPPGFFYPWRDELPPMGVFYPWCNLPKSAQSWIRPESFAIHHWCRSWQ